ncbi:MAG TPA: tetratricopeptide repeat protein [Arenicellales bacterium]|nr:tetratricopeptide repeat protein [Arenicellales bacterium]
MPDPGCGSDAIRLLAAGRRHHRSGALEQAAACYRSVLAAEPGNPDALYLLGLVAYRRGSIAEALDLASRAIGADPGHALAHASLAQMLQDRGDDERAAAHYQRAAVLRPDNADFHNGLGLSLARLGRLQPAIAALRRAVTLRPDMAGAYNNLGNIQRLSGDLEGAVESYRRCLVLDPESAEAHNNLGVLYHQQQRLVEARRELEDAITIRSAYAEAHSNLGAVLNDAGDTEGALLEFHNAMDLKPSCVEACINAGMALHRLGDHQHSRQTLDLALRMAPGHPTARWARCVAELDVVYPSTEAMRRSRRGYEERLRQIAGDSERDVRTQDLSTVVGALQPFLLPYQGGDDLALQRLYGDYVHRLAGGGDSESGDPGGAGAAPARRADPLRVGIVSGYFHDHSNWKIPIRGWLRHMGGRVALYCYYTGARSDQATRQARSWCRRFHEARSAEQLAEAIREDDIEVLIYPEVGMHPVTARLAARRLAPVQCTSWGHPVTSGLPTMDYFLSSELMEPPDGDSAYRETLVRLPGLSFICERQDYPGTGAAARDDLGLGREEVVYLCVQNLSKYLPQHDHLLAAIAGAVPRARLVFIQGPRDATGVFEKRLRTAFDQAGVSFDDHVSFLPRLASARYRELNLVADICLDTLEWSGCNSTLEALSCGVPVVTLPGRWMRGRHSYGMYLKMGFQELCAADEKDYVDLAVRLGTDAAWRRAVRRGIGGALPGLFGDPTPAHALVDFLLAQARGEATTPA